MRLLVEKLGEERRQLLALRDTALGKHPRKSRQGSPVPLLRLHHTHLLSPESVGLQSETQHFIFLSS